MQPSFSADLSQSQNVEDLLRRGLDWLARLVQYDLGTVFLLQGEQLVARVARGPLARSEVREHTLSLADFPSLQEALETRRARAFTEDDHRHGEGDPFDGVLDLTPGHACMVVPLAAGERVYGVMTLDASRCETYPSEVVNLVEVYGQLLATALQNLEGKSEMERLHAQDHAHAKLLEAQLGGESEGVLETSASQRVRALASRAKQVAETDTPVLLLGETGTGKERLARALHRWSRRGDAPFVTINCAAIPAGLMESELFGHVRGAFTGALKDRAGRVQMAQGGTLLLDEIGELPVELQAKLLRVLQEKTFEPVGSDRTQKADVRILAATHVDLRGAIAKKQFREDLYYRLSVFPLSLLPLRERLEDLPQLCDFLLAEQARRSGRKLARVSPEGIAKLAGYGWPGNLRELANVLERATILSRAALLGPDVLDVPSDGGKAGEGGHSRDDVSTRVGGERDPLPTGGESARSGRSLSGAVATLDEVQREHIRQVLALTEGRIYGKDGAAALLGLKPSTLQSRMKKLGVDRV